MVMGPAVGAILGDLGAEVIKIEPISAIKPEYEEVWVRLFLTTIETSEVWQWTLKRGGKEDRSIFDSEVRCFY